MSKSLIGTLCMGLASLGLAQNPQELPKEEKINDTATVNQQYLDNVRGGTISSRVFTLEKKASRYNIKKSLFYGDTGEVNKIKFSQDNDNLMVTYGLNGKILFTSESYKNLMLPTAVRNRVYIEYPGCTMLNNTYLVSYHHKRGTKKMYKIQVQKEQFKKTLSIDTEGNLL
ncbi:hypothetical protein [Pseudozobellia sp. WGM2]|uniref:hypothetical protein n=1 Tax=Pseudozobellia sp. WGM2 TaxID=2787625 RepID=UPI001AE07396|nr:hypothetical protein [Pseudozobellia sp. WGM2]